MSKELVKKSLYKFINDGLENVFVTYNSNYADMESFTKITSQQTLQPLNTVDTQITGTIASINNTTVIGNNTLFLSELNDGDTIKVNDSLALISMIISDTELELKFIFEQVWNIGDNIYIPSGKEFIVLDEFVETFKTDWDINGWSINVNGVSCEIENYDLSKSQILLKENCSEVVQGYDYDTQIGDEIEISLESWAYMKSTYALPMAGSMMSAVVNNEKYVLYVKTKNDNNKEKINNILQNINDVIYNGYLNFPVYDTDGITKLATASIEGSSITSKEIYDNTSDIQSFMVEFNVSYRMKYK